MSVYVYAHMCAGFHGGSMRVLDLLELESLLVVSDPMWVLGMELLSSPRAASSLTKSCTSPQPL